MPDQSMFTGFDHFAFVFGPDQQQHHVYFNGTFLFGLVEVGAFLAPLMATAVSSTQTT